MARLDRQVARRIRDYMVGRVAALPDPRVLGRPLRGPLREYWRYRVGDYRVICDIQDQLIRIVVVTVGHRGDVYE
jgi:mRNA interferase RelE/StbE